MIQDYTGDIVIVGDFNLDYKLATYYVKKYKDLIYRNDLHQTVNKSTRETRNCSTVVDHIVTKVTLQW